MSERTLLHEVWEELEDAGGPTITLLLAGPGGEAVRRMLGPSARLITTIRAGNHVEAMTLYYRLMGFGEYSVDNGVAKLR